MKKITATLFIASLVLILNGSALAHPTAQINPGAGFGFSISDGNVGISSFWLGNSRVYNNFSAPYPNRPYLGWGGFRGYDPGHHHHWGHHRHGHHHKKFRRGHGHGHHRPFKGGHHRHGRHRHGRW